jgi:two-component system response regulator YesN
LFRVLLADDEMLFRRGMSKMIDWESYGFCVSDTAEDGEQALELWKKNRYELVITDLKMPLLDGLGLIRELARIKAECEVIIVSAYGEFAYAQTAMQYGVKYYLLKPVDEEVLCGFLGRIAEELSDREHEKKSDVDPDIVAHQLGLATNGVVTEIRRYINDHYREAMSLNSLAKLYSFTPLYLGKIFKRDVGISFNEYLNNCRIRAAQEYIEQGGYSSGEIGELVGYKDITYFYKCFKHITGVTPKEYRKQLIGRKEE